MEEPVAPWWARPLIRVTVLLAVLAGVASYGVLGLIHSARSSGPSDCWVGPVPRMLKLNAATVAEAVAVTGIKSLAAARNPEMQGLQQPLSAWSDRYPMTDPAAISPSTTVGAGYEIRWRSPKQGNQAADLFVFANANDAGLWVREAASTRCR